MDKVIQILFYSGEHGWVRDTLQVPDEKSTELNELETDSESKKSMYLE